MTLGKAGETVEALFKKAVLFSKIKGKKFFKDKEEKLLHEHKPVLAVWIQPSHSMKHRSHKQSRNNTSNTVCSLSRQKEMVHIFILKISKCFSINFPRCVVPCACTWGLSVRPCACRSDKCSELGKRLTPATIWLRFDMRAGTLETSAAADLCTPVINNTALLSKDSASHHLTGKQWNWNSGYLCEFKHKKQKTKR